MEKIRDFVEEKLFNTSEKGDTFDINNMLAYEFRGDESNELWLHIGDTRDVGLAEKLKLLRTGFNYLAYLLKVYDRFKNIEIISGTSWIVTKNPGLLKKLGFTVDNNAEGFIEGKKEYYAKGRYRNKEKENIEPSYAYISKEKFIELYGTD